MIDSLEEAEFTIQKEFTAEFPNANYGQWNQSIDDMTAKNIIRNVGRASRIDVKLFIEDLW